MLSAIAKALEAGIAQLAAAPGGEVLILDGATLAITGLPGADFNGLLRLRSTAERDATGCDQRIKSAVTVLRSRSVPFS